MRSLGGFVLLAGIGVGLFVYLPAPVDRGTTLEEAKRAIAQRFAASLQAPAATPAHPSSRLASFAPGVSLAHGDHRVQVAKAPTAEPQATAPAPKIEPIADWQTNVAAAGALQPTDADSRYKLVVDIQQQLKRVGCYWGRANGAWNNSTREAMRQFTTRSNSALPVDNPDYLLLSLLKSHNGRSCGASDETVAAAPAAPEVLPWKPAEAQNQQATRLFTPVPTSVVTNEQLPGRMSIGGPRDFAPMTREPLIPGSQPSGDQGMASAAYDPSSANSALPPSAPAAAAKPRPSKKTASSHRRASPGTPRYNLMLSLGGVY